jgi:hypothetical protein
MSLDDHVREDVYLVFLCYFEGDEEYEVRIKKSDHTHSNVDKMTGVVSNFWCSRHPPPGATWLLGAALGTSELKG